MAAKTFYRLISEATHIDMTRASDFKLLDRKAVNVLLSMREKRAFFRAPVVLDRLPHGGGAL